MRATIFKLDLFIVAIVLSYFVVLDVNAASEEQHTIPWCLELGGTWERSANRMPDGTYPDCITDTSIIEVDWANKFYEGIGQALHYYRVSDKSKRPMLGLIIDPDSAKDLRYFEKAKAIGEANCPHIKVVPIRSLP